MVAFRRTNPFNSYHSQERTARKQMLPAGPAALLPLPTP